MTDSVISAQNVGVVLNGHRVLSDVSFDIAKGTVAAIVGPNGSGKTTLMKAMLGLVSFQGDISILGARPDTLAPVASHIGYVPQHLDFDRTMPVTVEELLGFHLTPHTKSTAIAEALDAVHATELRDRMIGVLSGGEFQRVLLALALLNHPELLFLDEPAAGVDIEGAAEFYALIRELRAERRMTVIMVSHDIDVVFRHADTVLCINHALVCQGAPRDALTADTLSRLYGAEHDVYLHKEKHA